MHILAMRPADEIPNLTPWAVGTGVSIHVYVESPIPIGESKGFNDQSLECLFILNLPHLPSYCSQWLHSHSFIMGTTQGSFHLPLLQNIVHSRSSVTKVTLAPCIARTEWRENILCIEP